MLDKLKDLYNLRKEAQAMQAKLGATQVTGTSKNGSLKITINGNQDVLNVVIEEGMELTKQNLEKAIKEAITQAQTNLKQVLASQFKDLF